MPELSRKPPLGVRYDMWSHPTFRWGGGSSDHLADARTYAVRHGYRGILLIPRRHEGDLQETSGGDTENRTEATGPA